MKIINFGNCIDTGKYQLHSEFSSVHNYSNAGNLISLVSSNVGFGPNNIVFDKIPVSAFNTITILERCIMAGEVDFKIPHSIKTEEQVFSFEKANDLENAAAVIKNKLITKSVQKSLVFLINPSDEKCFTSSFEKAFMNMAKLATMNMSISNLPVIAKKMRGVGFGLTPSGDDFNCGMLYGIHLSGIVLNHDFSQLLSDCYASSLGNNLISNSFLKYAFSNLYYEYFLKLLKSLKQRNENGINYYFSKVVSAGHTSGADLLTGFVLTIKGVLND